MLMRPALITEPVPFKQPPIGQAAMVLCAAGGLLHLYTALFKADGGGMLGFVGLLLAWSYLPYALCVAMAVRKHWFAAAFGGALTSLAFDAGMHHAVFIAPKSSTAALGLLFMPMWNLLLMMPAGAIVATLVARGASRILDKYGQT